MAAEKPGRRKITAKKAAQRFGISERSVRRIMAEPREEFLQRAATHRAEAVRLREVEKLPYKVIAERMGVPEGTAKRLVHDARRYAKESQDFGREVVAS